MGKRKKKNESVVGMSASSSGREHMSTSIDGVENGFVVNVSGESGGKNPSYFSKRFIAADRPEALRIAASGLSGSRTKSGKKKSGGRKKIALKTG